MQTGRAVYTTPEGINQSVYVSVTAGKFCRINRGDRNDPAGYQMVRKDAVAMIIEADDPMDDFNYVGSRHHY